MYTTSYELNIESDVAEMKRAKLVHAKVGETTKLSCNEPNNNGYHDGGEHISQRWSRQYGQMQLGTDILSVSCNQINILDV